MDEISFIFVGGDPINFVVLDGQVIFCEAYYTSDRNAQMSEEFIWNTVFRYKNPHIAIDEKFLNSKIKNSKRTGQEYLIGFHRDETDYLTVSYSFEERNLIFNDFIISRKFSKRSMKTIDKGYQVTIHNEVAFHTIVNHYFTSFSYLPWVTKWIWGNLKHDQYSKERHINTYNLGASKKRHIKKINPKKIAPETDFLLNWLTYLWNNLQSDLISPKWLLSIGGFEVLYLFLVNEKVKTSIFAWIEDLKAISTLDSVDDFLKFGLIYSIQSDPLPEDLNNEILSLEPVMKKFEDQIDFHEKWGHHLA